MWDVPGARGWRIPGPQTIPTVRYSLRVRRSPDTAPRSLRTARSPRRWVALGVLVTAMLLLSIDGTVLYLAVPALTRALSPTAEQILWVGDAYSLALVGALVVAGTLADRVGRKRMLLIGVVAFGLASVLAAFAPTAGWLIAARALLGLSGALIMPSTLALIRNIFLDARERTRAIAIWSAGFGVGAAIGPLVGGFLLEHFWWGSVFLINVPVMALVLVLGLWLLPESRDPQPGRFDILSAVLSMLTLVPLVYAVKHAVSAGFDGTITVCVVLGAAAGWWFVRRQRRLETPMIDVALFRIPAFTGAVVSNVVAIFALTGLLFFFSQYLQLVRGFRPLIAGLAELPTTIASMAVILLVGVLLARLGRGRAIATGFLLAAAGLGAVSLAVGAENYLWLALALIPIGLGIGLASTLTSDAIVSAAPPEKAGSVSSVTETSYELGVVLGIAVLGSFVNFAYRLGLPDLGDLPAEQAGRVRDSLASAAATLDPSSPLLEEARHAFTAAISAGSLAAAVLSAIAAVIAWRLIPSSRESADADASARAH